MFKYKKSGNFEGNPLTGVIGKNGVPGPSLVKEQLGNDDPVVESFYVAAAFMYGLRMRNSSPSFLHVVNTALKPDYRLRDRKFPSGYSLEVGDKEDLLFHEFCEDVGKDITGAFIMWDFVRNNYPARAHSLELKSNYGQIVLNPLERRLENKVSESENSYVEKNFGRIETDEKRREIYGKYSSEIYHGCSEVALSMLERALNRTEFNEKTIKNHANYILGKYSSKEKPKGPYDYLKVVDRAPGITNEEKRFIKEITEKNIALFLKGVRNIQPIDLEEFVIGEYNRIFDLLKKREFVEADYHLIYHGESLFMATLEKTIYDMYLGGIKDDALKKFKEKGDYDDAPLSVIIQKLTDLVATVVMFEVHHLEHMLHQFRKSSRGLHMGIDTIKGLKELGVDKDVYSRRLEPAMLYLWRILKNRVEVNLNRAEEDSKIETNYSPLIPPLDYMKKVKLPELRKRLRIERSFSLGPLKLML